MASDETLRLLRDAYDQMVADWYQIDGEWGGFDGRVEDDELIAAVRLHLSGIDGDGWWKVESGQGWHHFMREGMSLCGRWSRDGERPVFADAPPPGRTCKRCSTALASPDDHVPGSSEEE